MAEQHSTESLDLRHRVETKCSSGAPPAAGDSVTGQVTTADRRTRNLVKLFKLLADETRLRILIALHEQGELHVRALCELFDQSQPAVSHHLSLLRVAGLVERRRVGKHNFYHLVPQRAEQLLDLMSRSADEELAPPS